MPSEKFWSYSHHSQLHQSGPFRAGPSIVSLCLQEEGVCYLVPSDHHISPRAATHGKVSSVGSPGFLGLFVDSHVAHAFLLGTPCICGDVLFVLRLLKCLSYRCPQHPASPPSPPFMVAVVILLHTAETPQGPRGSFFHRHTCFNCVSVKQALKKCFLNDQNNKSLHLAPELSAFAVSGASASPRSYCSKSRFKDSTRSSD